MALSRRDFVKLCSGTVAGFGVSQMFHPAIHEAFAQTLTGERPPVFWVQGQGCTGCSVTLLNSTHRASPTCCSKSSALNSIPTVMAAEGEGAGAYDARRRKVQGQVHLRR
ncbi:MAG: twin-arginine translocation signal domain-containing protein [Bilophila wadsworthia]